MFALLIVVLLEGGGSVVQADPLLHESLNSCVETAADVMNIVLELVPDHTGYDMYYRCVPIGENV